MLKNLSRTLSVSSVKNKKVEIVLSPLTVEWFISQKITYEFAEPSDGKSVKTSANTGQAMEWESYPSYTQYDSIMQSFPIPVSVLM